MYPSSVTVPLIVIQTKSAKKIRTDEDTIMPTDLTYVRGIGPAAAETIKKHGIVSVEDLASADITDIIVIPGFGESRASAVIAAAKMIVVDLEDVNSAQPAVRVPVDQKEETTETETETKAKKKKKKSEKSKSGKKRKKKKNKKRAKGKKKN